MECKVQIWGTLVPSLEYIFWAKTQLFNTLDKCDNLITEYWLRHLVDPKCIAYKQMLICAKKSYLSERKHLRAFYTQILHPDLPSAQSKEIHTAPLTSSGLITQVLWSLAEHLRMLSYYSVCFLAHLSRRLSWFSWNNATKLGLTLLWSRASEPEANVRVSLTGLTASLACLGLGAVWNVELKYNSYPQNVVEWKYKDNENT